MVVIGTNLKVCIKKSTRYLLALLCVLKTVRSYKIKT